VTGEPLSKRPDDTPVSGRFRASWAPEIIGSASADAGFVR